MKFTAVRGQRRHPVAFQVLSNSGNSRQGGGGALQHHAGTAAMPAPSCRQRRPGASCGRAASIYGQPLLQLAQLLLLPQQRSQAGLATQGALSGGGDASVGHRLVEGGSAAGCAAATSAAASSCCFHNCCRAGVCRRLPTPQGHYTGRTALKANHPYGTVTAAGLWWAGAADGCRGGACPLLLCKGGGKWGQEVGHSGFDASGKASGKACAAASTSTCTLLQSWGRRCGRHRRLRGATSPSDRGLQWGASGGCGDCGTARSGHLQRRSTGDVACAGFNSIASSLWERAERSG